MEYPGPKGIRGQGEGQQTGVRTSKRGMEMEEKVNPAQTSVIKRGSRRAPKMTRAKAEEEEEEEEKKARGRRARVRGS